MRNLLPIATALILWQTVATAQTSDASSPVETSAAVETTGTVGAIGTTTSQGYIPLTASERLRLYLKGAFGPGAIAKAAASAGISQWRDVPKEWRQGSEAYGERFGNAYARHVIEASLENGSAALLHEDNRYVRSTEAGFWKRSKHAVASTFVARDNAGSEHFAYSRVGGSAGAVFISRIWQPHSTNTAGDGAVSFGISMASKIGWNVFKEFRPARFQ